MEPQKLVVPSAVKRPIAVTILAVLNLLVGGGGILFAPMILLAVLAPPPPSQQMSGSSHNFQSISFLWLIGSHCTSVFLVATGVGLMRMKKWAWWMCIGCAAYSLVSFLLSRAFLLVMSVSASTHRDAFVVLLVGGTAMLCLPTFMHPVLTLFVLLPSYVRRAFEHASALQTQFDVARVAEFEPSGKSQVKSKLSPAIRWLLFGPALPPYRPSRGKGRDTGWKWAVLLAPTTFAALLVVTVGILAKFEFADVPFVFMGTLALMLGPLALACALFEWRWFFELRAPRGVRWWAGDQGARWLYVGASELVLLIGLLFVGHAAMPSMIGKHPFFRMTNGSATAQSLTNTPGRFTGERSPLCGGTGGNPFERFDPDFRPMVGIRYELGNWGGQQVIAKIEPLFDRSTSGDRVVMAKDGYQVSGLLVDSRDFVNAVRINFVRTDGGQNKTSETYQSDWIGTATNQGTPQQVGGDDRIPVGIFGRQGIITDALGLLFKPDDN